MNRIQLIRELIRKQNFQKYLEIGTNKGESFFPVRCRHKLAVDPGFQIPPHKAVIWYIKNPVNFRNRYFKLTSDDFFQKNDELLTLLGDIDISLVDGLHTFGQSLKDVLNVLKYLNPGGIIIMHDCYPPDETAATPASSIDEAKLILKDAYKGAWCGDVWKTIVYLKDKHSDVLDVSVINTDFGLGIVRKRTSGQFNNEIDRSLFEKINIMEFALVKSNPELLNLKPASYASDLIIDIRTGLS
jgi:hypothetical protein